MPDSNSPLFEQLLQRAEHIGPEYQGRIDEQPGALVGKMPFGGTPIKTDMGRVGAQVGGYLGKLPGLKGLIEDGEGSPIMQHVLGWAGLQGNPSGIGAAEELIRLAQAKAAGTAVDWAKKGNKAWHDYTGHNLIPTPHGIINKLLGTNYGNE